MRHETLLKIIIIVFAVTLIILATFVYGNIQRSNQKKSSSNDQNTVQTQTNSETVKDSNVPDDKQATNNSSNNQATQSTAPAQTPAPSSTTPSTGAKTANIPATGASNAVIPMTILSVLGYLYIKSRSEKKALVYGSSQIPDKDIFTKFNISDIV